MQVTGGEDGRPDIGRARDWLLTGSDAGWSLPADRELARKILELDPGARERLELRRRFIRRAALLAADAGVTQFLDVAPGLPTPPLCTADAWVVQPGAVLAVAEPDEIAAEAWACAGQADRRVTLTRADPRDPAAVLDSLAGVLDLSRPVAVITGYLAQHTDPAGAAEMAQGYMRPLAARSWLAASVPRYGSPGLPDAAAALTGVRLASWNPAEFAAMFGGLDLVRPGISSARCWLSCVRHVPEAGTVILAAAAVKP